MPEHALSLVTLRDIAKELGISHVSVSLALRNSPRVSQATRTRVQAAALRLGYLPNIMATALASHRQQGGAPIRAELAWLNLWPDPARLHNYREFQLYWEGAQEAAQRAGYRLQSFNLSSHKSLARIQQILIARGIPGVLLPPHQITPDWNGFQWDKFSLVKFGHSLPQLLINTVGSDQVSDALLAIDKIHAHGYQRVGFITDIRAATCTRFVLGFLQAQLLRGTPGEIPPFVFTRTNLATEHSALGLWLKNYKPEAILTDIPNTRELLAGHGINVPRDIALATTSLLDGRSDAGIDQNSREIGHAAVELLVGLIHHERRGLENALRLVSIQGSWSDGSSLPVKTGTKRSHARPSA